MRIKHDYYFMKCKDWYMEDDERGMMVLTDKAPKNDPLIKKSYKEYLDNRTMSYNCLFADLNNIDIENNDAVEKKINKITS